MSELKRAKTYALIIKSSLSEAIFVDDKGVNWRMCVPKKYFTLEIFF